MKTARYVEDDGEMIQVIRLLLKLLDYKYRSFCSATGKPGPPGRRTPRHHAHRHQYAAYRVRNADGYVFKPVTIDDLEDKINIAI